MLTSQPTGGAAMSRLDDVRKTFEATVGTLTPAKAQQLAKGFLEPNAAKEQVAKTAADLVEWSQRNRDRLREFIRAEIQDQLRQMGLASQKELDALKKRVRELERAAGMTASGRAKPATKKPAAKKETASTSGSAKKTTSRARTKTTAKSTSKAKSTG
jgi:polyhydroxyalkanoate synthesis regulator phasin